MMLAHDIRGRCWWDGSRGWTSPGISHYMLLLCDRWQHRGSLTQWHLTWKHVWNKGVPLNSSMQKKNGFIDIYWWLRDVYGVKQWVWVQWGSGWCISSVSTMDDFHWCSMQALVLCWWKCIANSGDYVEETVFCRWEFASSNSGILPFVAIVISMEIKRRRYFWSNLCMCSPR